MRRSKTRSSHGWRILSTNLMSKSNRHSGLNILLCLIWGATTVCAQSSQNATQTPDDDNRPLSADWLPPGDMPRADQAVMELGRELSRPEPAQSNRWSSDTEAQLKIALKSNVYFTKVSWSGFKCSIDGCIVAWEMPKRQQKPEQSLADESFAVMKQVLSQLPNRTSRLKHADYWITESHQNAKYHYFVYFYFPEALGENSGH